MLFFSFGNKDYSFIIVYYYYFISRLTFLSCDGTA